MLRSFDFWAVPTDEWKVSDFPLSILPFSEAQPPLLTSKREAEPQNGVRTVRKVKDFPLIRRQSRKLNTPFFKFVMF